MANLKRVDRIESKALILAPKFWSAKRRHALAEHNCEIGSFADLEPMDRDVEVAGLRWLLYAMEAGEIEVSS